MSLEGQRLGRDDLRLTADRTGRDRRACVGVGFGRALSHAALAGRVCRADLRANEGSVMRGPLCTTDGKKDAGPTQGIAAYSIRGNYWKCDAGMRGGGSAH